MLGHGPPLVARGSQWWVVRECAVGELTHSLLGFSLSPTPRFPGPLGELEPETSGNHVVVEAGPNPSLEDKALPLPPFPPAPFEVREQCWQRTCITASPSTESTPIPALYSAREGLRLRGVCQETSRDVASLSG